jgi:hypothetical protein
LRRIKSREIDDDERTGGTPTLQFNCYQLERDTAIFHRSVLGSLRSTPRSAALEPTPIAFTIDIA